MGAQLKTRMGSRWGGVLLWVSGVMVFFALAYSLIWLLDPTRFPVTTVKFIGQRHFLTPKALQGVTLPYLRDGFFRLRVSALQADLLNLPWVERAEIRRIWPNQLLIHVEERVPHTFWITKTGQKGIISQKAFLFYPPASDMQQLQLPVLEGPQGKADLVRMKWLEMDAVLAELGLKISHLRFVARGAFEIVLSNHMVVVLGKNDPVGRLRVFVRAYQHYLAPKHAEIVSVDMRYSNGMAVGWRTG